MHLTLETYSPSRAELHIGNAFPPSSPVFHRVKSILSRQYLFGSSNVAHCSHMSQPRKPFPPDDAAQLLLFRSSSDYRLWYLVPPILHETYKIHLIHLWYADSSSSNFLLWSPKSLVRIKVCSAPWTRIAGPLWPRYIHFSFVSSPIFERQRLLCPCVF